MKKLLVVVDMQNDFIDGSLGTKEADSIVGNVLERISEYEKNGDMVVFTRDTHDDNYKNTQEGKKLPVEHCKKGTDGWQIADRLQRDNMIIFDKTTFGSLALGEFIKKEKFCKIELCGVCTDICVISNALLIKAFLPDSDIVVNSACCAGTTPQNHKNALSAMSMCHIDII